MGEQAFNAVVSTPVSTNNSLRWATDNKRQQAMQNASNMSRHAYESVAAYNERMAKFREDLQKQILAENTSIAEKKYKEIMSLNLWQTKDLSKLQSAQSQLDSLFRFTHNNQVNSSFDSGIYLAKRLNNQTSEKIYQIKRGSEPGNTENLALYDTDYQAAGERDILS